MLCDDGIPKPKIPFTKIKYIKNKIEGGEGRRGIERERGVEKEGRGSKRERGVTEVDETRKRKEKKKEHTRRIKMQKLLWIFVPFDNDKYNCRRYCQYLPLSKRLTKRK